MQSNARVKIVAAQKSDSMPITFRSSAMPASVTETVIIGVTTSGQIFRPSDWAERLCGCMALFGENQRIAYSPYVKPIIAANVKCVVVDRGLEQTDVEAFAFLMSFARDNDLQLRDGRHEIRHAIKARPRVQAV